MDSTRPTIGYLPSTGNDYQDEGCAVSILRRSGSVRVRGGKGEKFRTVPLNADAWKAIDTYLEELGERRRHVAVHG